MDDLMQHLVAALVYALLGIVIFVLSFIVLDRLTPGSLWKEIMEEHNTALAVMGGAIAIGISIIIAAAIW
jgi:putative membrane protein